MVHHGAGLRRLTKDPELVGHLATDYREATLTDADRAILDYSVRLTQDPSSVATDGVEQLREHGFDDRAILDICLAASYYNFANRVADGLGIELEEYWTPEEMP